LSFRELCPDVACSVQEMLNKRPLIRAHKFVGRAQGKDVTDKGLTQKEQKTVSNSFPG
jgi:ERCC4-related helicase